jgi:predicted TIM-barrel fold metal-dependent hydrolase
MDTPDIVDCHAHIFPPLGQACGLSDTETHLLFQQRAMHTHGNQPVRRLRDHAIIEARDLWDATDASEQGRARHVNFRVGRLGRFEWTVDGEDYYVQFLPPSLQDMHFAPEVMVAQMDYAGIHTTVLQNDHIYGDLSEYFAEAIARYPERFIGLANVDEAFAYREDQLEVLHRSVNELGMSGLYYTLSGFFRNGYSGYFSDELYYPFWDAVSALDIPVFWVFLGDSPMGGFKEEMALFGKWLERYPQIPSVLVHGVPTALFADEKDRVTLPDYMREILTQFPVYCEVLYPIAWGGKTDYPYARAQDHIHRLYDQLGPGRLVWGSDMPNVERYCTYRQSLSYMDYCDFFNASDRQKILGGTMRALFARK